MHVRPGRNGPSLAHGNSFTYAVRQDTIETVRPSLPSPVKGTLPMRPRTLYFVSLLSALVLLSDSRADEPKPKLDQHGDPLPDQAVARLGTIRFRQEGGSAYLAFLPKGDSLVSVGYGRDEHGPVRFWEVPSGKPLPLPPGIPESGCKHFSVSPRANLLAAASDARMILYDVEKRCVRQDVD